MRTSIGMCKTCVYLKFICSCVCYRVSNELVLTALPGYGNNIFIMATDATFQEKFSKLNFNYQSKLTTISNTVAHLCVLLLFVLRSATNACHSDYALSDQFAACAQLFRVCSANNRVSDANQCRNLADNFSC